MDRWTDAPAVLPHAARCSGSVTWAAHVGVSAVPAVQLLPDQTEAAADSQCVQAVPARGYC